MKPLGIRSNNPTNLRPDGWVGEIGVNEKGFAIFDTMAHGLRAAAKNLMAYERKHGLKTVDGIVRRWTTTDQEPYIKHVCAVCGVKPDDKLSLTDSNTLFWLLVGMGEMENGKAAFSANVSDEDIDAGVALALMKG